MTYDPLVAAAEATGVDPSTLRLDDLGSVRTTHLTVVSLSDFNGARALQGQDPVELAAGTCALANNMDMVTPLAQAVLDAAPTVTIAGTDYALAGPLYDTQLEDNAMAATALVVITPDEAVEALRAEGCIPDTQYLNVMYADNGQDRRRERRGLGRHRGRAAAAGHGRVREGRPGRRRPLREPLVAGHAHSHGERNALPVCRLRLMITYLALYIGFVFLISTAAILAIQQLSQASDSTPRYRILWKLGCDRGMIYRSLARPSARVLPRAAGAGGMPFRLRHRRTVRFPAGRHWRVLGRPHHDGRWPHAGHLRRLHAGDLPCRPRHREGLAATGIAPSLLPP